jgi:predicted DNA-binding WGR domain protein
MGVQPPAVHQPELFPVEVLAQFQLNIAFVSINPEQNRSRFYHLRWQRTLWEEWVLVQTWGRLGTSERTRMTVYEDRGQAQKAIEQIITHRLRHGYALIMWS